MARGIKDKVAILGMGCARFGERWEADADTLMVEAYEEALEDAGIETGQLHIFLKRNLLVHALYLQIVIVLLL